MVERLGTALLGATPLFEHAMPVPVEPAPDESGVGYGLRLAAANGLSHKALLDLLKANGAGDGGRQKEVALSFLGSASPTSLHDRFPVKLGRKSGIEFQGHRLPLRSMVRTRKPQVCAVCLAENRYCRAIWELSLSVVCLSHRCLLTDECPTCQRPLTWDRPSVDWGSCGHCLARARVIQDVPEWLVRFQQLVEELYERREGEHAAPEPSSMLQLSLGGWFAWAYAFGLCERETGTVDRGAYSEILGTREAVDVLMRAHARWDLFCAGPPEEQARLKLLVAEPALLSMMTTTNDPRDRAAGVAIYRSLFGLRLMNEVARRMGVVEQLSLFE